jgi:hypothetical protein
MKARFWVVCEEGISLRGRLNAKLTRDRRRPDDSAKDPVRLKRQKNRDRRRGWSWVHSRKRGRGAVRYRWNPRLRILECWAVTRHGNRPSQLVGEFVEEHSHRGWLTGRTGSVAHPRPPDLACYAPPRASCRRPTRLGQG